MEGTVMIHPTAEVSPEAVIGQGTSVWHQYTVRVDGGRDRDEAAQRLRQAGVGTGIFYPIPLHQHQYMRDIVGDLHLPIAEAAAKEVLSLPVHPKVSTEDLETIIAEVNKL